MKICAIICEYNPFHLGHQYLIESIKKTNRFDAILCIMSENFTQRGDIAILDSYTRAKHAVLGGADAVVSLPCIFATSPAEIFAKGAIKLLSSIPSVSSIAFGVENGSERDFIQVAEKLNKEDAKTSEIIRQGLNNGLSYIQARTIAYQEQADLLSKPNNILGIEYTRAILATKAEIEILPIQRVGQAFNDSNISNEIASASSIRAHLCDHEYLKRQLPNFVEQDIIPFQQKNYEIACMTAVALSDKQKLSSILDCTEGLENAISAPFSSYHELIDSVSGKRYTKARIKRILLHNLLSITKNDILEGLNAPLYLKLLAFGNNKQVLTELSHSAVPLLTKGEHSLHLDFASRKIYDLEENAKRIFEICTEQKIPKNFLKK